MGARKLRRSEPCERLRLRTEVQEVMRSLGGRLEETEMTAYLV